MNRRNFLAVSMASTSALAAPALVGATAKPVLKVGLGPQQPTQADTLRVWEPIYNEIAERVGARLQLNVANDWAGISTALANEQVDLAQMGPWGYVLARNAGNARPICVMLVDGKPVYQAIVVARPGLQLSSFPQGAKGMSMQMLDVGSTSGWLVPTHYLKSKGIDPKTFFGRYAEGASAAAAQMATAEGRVDLATGWDTHRNTMIRNGTIREDSNQVVWKSDPLPNEVVAVRSGLPSEMVAALQKTFVELRDEIRRQLPKPYTGFESTTHAPYAVLEKMGRDLGVLRS